MNEKKEKINIEMTEEQLDTLGFTPEQLKMLREMVRSSDVPPDPETERAKTGRLLSVLRERAGKTQRDIAKELGYKSQNFVYMVEKGRSKVPANKIDNFVSAYEADAKLSSALIRSCHPEMWRSFLDQMLNLANVDPGDTDNQIDRWIEEEMKK